MSSGHQMEFIPSTKLYKVLNSNFSFKLIKQNAQCEHIYQEKKN